MKLDNLAGRGIIEQEKRYYECQFYLAFAAEKEFERINLIRQFISMVNQKNLGCRAKRIPEIPQSVTEEFIRNQYPDEYSRKYGIPIGIEYESIGIRMLFLDQTFSFSLVNSSGEGKHAFQAYLLRRLISEDIYKVYLLDDVTRTLDRFEDKVSAYVVGLDAIHSFLEQLEADILDRRTLKSKEAILLNDADQIIVWISTAALAREMSAHKEISAIYKRLYESCRGDKLCFIFADLNNERISLRSGDLLRMTLSERNYLIYEDINLIEICDIPAAIRREYKKQLVSNEAYLVRGDVVEKIKTIEA